MTKEINPESIVVVMIKKERNNTNDKLLNTKVRGSYNYLSFENLI